jgi:hypothetical protein
MAKHATHRIERWRPIIADWRSSGLSVTAFCRARNVNRAGFHRWRTILEQLDRSPTTPLAVPTEPKSPPVFVPLRVLPDAVVEVILPSGLQLRVPLSADAQQLARLVHALGASPC